MPDQPSNTIIGAGPYTVIGTTSGSYVELSLFDWPDVSHGSIELWPNAGGPGFTHHGMPPAIAEQLGVALIEAARVARGGKP